MFRFIKGFFIVFVAFITMAQPSFAKTVRFIQVTDAHYGFHENSAENLKQVVKDINKMKKIDFVAFTGDLIDVSNENDLKAFYKIADGLNVPYVSVIGNHDVAKLTGISKLDFIKITRQHSKKSFNTKSPNYVFKDNGLVFIVVDGSKDFIPGPYGYYRETTLDWLDKELTKYSKKNVVILQHFPIASTKTKYKNRYVHNSQIYFDILKKHNNVIAVCAGHSHINDELTVDNIYHITTDAFGHEPYYYKLIEITDANKKEAKVYTQQRALESAPVDSAN